MLCGTRTVVLVPLGVAVAPCDPPSYSDADTDHSRRRRRPQSQFQPGVFTHRN